MGTLVLRGGPLGIALLTLVVYSDALRNAFLNFDDLWNFLENPHYRGLGLRELGWMFTSAHLGHWIPVTWMTLGLDYLVWGMNPLGYHLTSVVFHSVNAGLFFLVARRLLASAMTGLSEPALAGGAGMAALFWALHPLRVESVAWVTERRDVVSGLFLLLTILAYLHGSGANGGGRRRWLLASLACYALALASKSIVATLPAVLILLDIHPLRRLGPGWREWVAPAARRVWMEKTPYLLLAGGGSVIAFYAVQQGGSALTGLDQLPLASRISVTFWSYWFYLWKTLVPFELSPLYELPRRLDLWALPFLWRAIAVTLLTGAAWLARRRWPAGWSVWAAYLLLLFPVSGLLHNGNQIAADRYSYLSSLGWALLVGAAAAALIRASGRGTLAPRLARAALLVGLVWIGGLAALTVGQIQVWRDSDTLWRYAVEFDADCALCQNHLGAVLAARGLHAQAVDHLERALALRPDLGIAHQNMGASLLQLGRPAEAGEHYSRVLVEVPSDVNALTGLGIALVELGRPREAIAYFEKAITVRPDAPMPRLGLVRAYHALGDQAAAREHFEILRRLDPDLAAWFVRPPSVLPRDGTARPR